MNMLSPQKIIPITDDAERQMVEVDQQLAGNGGNGDDIQYYSDDEDSEYKDGDNPLSPMKNGKRIRKTYRARLQAFYETITYDYAKDFARWFTESAKIEFSISVGYSPSSFFHYVEIQS